MKQLNHLITDKDIFDYVSSFLMKQGQRSYLSNYETSCAYRGIDNTKCAIGCIIADEFYDPIIEKQTAYDIEVQHAIELSLPNYKINERFLSKLQEVHDSYEIDQWEVNFSRFEFSNTGAFISFEGK